MNRVLHFLRGRLAEAGDDDRQLLDRFLAVRDEAAFAELVRRHGPVVWGVCRRRLGHTHDAEDAFQATFLVLVRRAAAIGRDRPLGPWLHKVAVLTARNVARGNRRRAAVSGPMGHDVPAPEREPAGDPDLDAALLALPERYRVPVVLCHLQGLSRREAAARLGCPEGTLSSLLSRALARLRVALGAGLPAVVLVPTALTATTARAASIYATSTLTAAGVSPAVAGLTDGVLHMFWMKKLTAGVTLAALVAGGLVAGLALRPGNVAQATMPLPSDPQAPAEDPDAAAKRLEKRLADLQKQKEQLDTMLADAAAEKAKLDEAKQAKAAKEAAAELGTDVAVVVENRKPAEYRIYEVVNGKVAEVTCSDLDVLTTYLRRALNDPQGPKKLRVGADKGHPFDHLQQVFAACATAGYTTASFSHDRPAGYFHRQASFQHAALVTEYYRAVVDRLDETPRQAQPTLSPGQVDLRKYAAPKGP